MITIFDVILELRPNASFVLKNNDLSTIQWNDERSIPTQDEIDLKIIEMKKNYAMNVLRRKRNRLLFQSDWRMTNDYPYGDQELWKAYRQKLRDITSTCNPELDEFENLLNINWPEKPN